MPDNDDEEVLEAERDQTAMIFDDLDEDPAEDSDGHGGGGVGHGSGPHGGVTIVHETRSSSIGSHALSGSSGLGDTGGGGGGIPIGVVVDGGTGEVLGTATFNPDTGVVEQSGTEVTVVEETSTPEDTSSGSSAGGAGGGAVEEPGAAPAAAEGSEASPDMGHLPPIVVDPNQFDFKDGPAANSQHSKCVEFRIAFRIGGKPAATPVSVFVQVFAPKQTHTGKTISNRQAGVMTAVAVSEAAHKVVEDLELGVIISTEAPIVFRKELNDIFRRHGDGFQAKQCFNK